MEELIKAAMALKGHHLLGCRISRFSLGEERRCSCKIGKVVGIAERLQALRQPELPLK